MKSELVKMFRQRKKDFAIQAQQIIKHIQDKIGLSAKEIYIGTAGTSWQIDSEDEKKRVILNLYCNGKLYLYFMGKKDETTTIAFYTPSDGAKPSLFLDLLTVKVLDILIRELKSFFY